MNDNHKQNNAKKTADKVGSKASAASDKKLTTWQKVRKVLSVIFTMLTGMFMVLVITSCIVATTLTVYILQFSDSTYEINLRDVELSYSSFLYAYDSEGEPVLRKTLNTDENRVWVDIEEIPQHVIDAFIANEDKRFFEHEGVDWTRTMKVTLKAFFSGGTEGGSTITQQLVRDITQDKDVNFGRKLREIFRAMELERKYTKMDILESYLNRISFGGTSYGIGSAASHYFNKDVSELTVAEAAILSGLIRSPSNYNPYTDLYKAKERQVYVLDAMYKQGLISTQEFEDAVNEQVKFRLPVKGDYFGYVDERYEELYGEATSKVDLNDLYYENVPWEEIEKKEEPYKWNGDYTVTQNWYEDAAINQVIEKLAEKKGITQKEARAQLYSGGYNIYINMDIELQDKMSALFEDPYTALSFYDDTAAKADLIQASFVLMDYYGNVKAIAGGLGEKEGDNCFNRATQSVRAVGSTIKPITSYTLAVEKGLITYSTMLWDKAGRIADEKVDWSKVPAGTRYDDESVTVPWPQNYERNYGTGEWYPAWKAVQKSTNTIAVYVMSLVDPREAYSFLVNKLHISTLVQNDVAYSPLALGAFTEGIKLYELAAAFQMIGNKGMYYEPYFFDKVTDQAGNVVLEQNVMGTQVIGSDTAYIVNRMMKTVITDPAGTGQHAALGNVEVIGKTGTSNDEKNLLFAGLTPEYVGVYRIGYDLVNGGKTTLLRNGGDGWRTLSRVWKAVMSEMVDTSQVQTFEKDSNVITRNYCTETGLLSPDSNPCPNTAVGYYSLNKDLPDTCHSKHDGTYFKEIEEHFEMPFYAVR